MKKTTIIIGLATLVLGSVGCQKNGIDDDTSFLETATAAAPGKVFDISNDNSGNVRITPTGEGASSFIIKFGHGTGSSAQAEVMPGNSATHVYPEGSYTVTIISKSVSGKETSADHPLQVTYRAPENLNVTTTQSVHNIKVKASALYAASYMVYFGDVPNEAGTPLASGGEVSHNYPGAGTYNLRVVALSGGAAKTEKVTPVTIYNALGFPITFDQTTVNYFFGTFGDNQQFAVVNNPDPSGLNTSAKVGRFTRGNQGWSGTYTPLDLPLDMANGKKIRVLAYNPDPAMVGKQLNVELEAGSSLSNGVAVLKTAFTTSGAWEELVFDFGTIAAIPASEKFKQLVLRFNDAANGGGAIIYVDNFRQTN